ncbi:MAG: DnaJ domain-containing protein [Sphingomicrobium sp.]
MRGEPCNYAILGLEPGADSAAIERAYKKLIKRHHPDRDGGDAARAAELNRAYRELRRRQSVAEPLLMGSDQPQASGDGWVRATMGMAALLALLLLAAGPVTGWVHTHFGKPGQPGQGRLFASAGTGGTMDGPLNNSTLENAVRAAAALFRSGNEAELLNRSRECHRTLRLRPSGDQLDRCAAFDDAVVELQNREPSWDGGPFSQPAVTRRQWAAALMMSNDYLAVDGRLDRIRLGVELRLASHEPPNAD